MSATVLRIQPGPRFAAPAAPWRARGSRRRSWAIAAALHVPLLLAMLHARIGVTTGAVPVAVLAVLPGPAPRAPAPLRLPAPALPRLAIPQAVLPSMAPVASPILPPAAAPTAALAAAPPASAASAPPPLILTLTPAQLRALARASDGTGKPASTLSVLGRADEALHLKALPHGETEVHVHGSCYRLVPSMRSGFDPFNHANETLVAPCG